MEQRLHVYGILGWMFQHIKIITWGAAGIFFKYLAEILGIAAESHSFRDDVNVIGAALAQKSLGFLDAASVYVIGKFLTGLLRKGSAQIADIDVQQVFSNVF